MLEEYKPKRSENLLKHEGDVAFSRDYYYKHKPNNLYFLLRKRYLWMNKYIKKNDKVLEVGCGIGVSKDFIRKDCRILLTDFDKHPWVDKKVDALNTKFPKNQFDVVFCSNMIHHLSFPKKFFLEMARILKPNGYLLIQEVNCSIMTKIILKILKHEGWKNDVDVYSLDNECNDSTDPWSSNNAIPNLLFDDINNFKKEIPYFKIKEQKFSELFIFALSGGVTAKAKTINLPFFILKFIDNFDNFLAFIAPNFFAMQRRIVLRKR